MIVIGSKAFLHRLPVSTEIKARINNSDYDVIMSVDEFYEWHSSHSEIIQKLFPTQSNKFKAIINKDGRNKQYEIELGLEGTSAQFLLNHQNEACDQVLIGHLDEFFNVLNPTYQLLTKRSHLIYPVHFEKNISDYHLLKKLVGDFEMNESMEEYYKLRSDEAKERYKQKTPNLNVTNEDFFSSKLIVENYFIHDDIHEVMKHHEKPVYEMIKRDFDKAWCEKDMFFDLPYDYQIQAVQEEAYTIALERYIIPQYGEEWSDYLAAYKRAVKRICTTLCSGWFRDFAIENYEEVIKRFNPNFVKIFKESYMTGKIRPIEGKLVPEFL